MRTRLTLCLPDQPVEVGVRHGARPVPLELVARAVHAQLGDAGPHGLELAAFAVPGAAAGKHAGEQPFLEHVDGAKVCAVLVAVAEHVERRHRRDAGRAVRLLRRERNLGLGSDWRGSIVVAVGVRAVAVLEERLDFVLEFGLCFIEVFVHGSGGATG